MIQIENEFNKSYLASIHKAFEHITHAVQQLDDQQVWYRPSSSSNSAGVIIQHLYGNLHQWVCSAVGGEAFERNRPQEFIDSNMISQKDILLESVR